MYYDVSTKLPKCINKPGPSEGAGSPCIFPFTFLGVSHFGCTAYDEPVADPQPVWCSTQTDENGVHVNNIGQYGYCGPDCPLDTEV